MPFVSFVGEYVSLSMTARIRWIGLDADDTLWHNESIFAEHHRKYCALLSRFHDSDTVEKILFQTEMSNLALYGYGIKSFTLSSIETAIKITHGAIATAEIAAIIDYGKEMLRHPVELLEGVEETVRALCGRYRLVVVTKGDLRDQERKVSLSGLADCFDHVEVVSDKTAESYERVLRRAGIAPDEFMMIGNSLKSDILPVLQLGGYGVFVPYPITWEHERAGDPPDHHERFFQLDSLAQLPQLLDTLERP